MSIFFFHDKVLPGDEAGFGTWLTEHSYEHTQFHNLALQQTNPIIVPDYDLLSFDFEPTVRASWLQAHEQVHVALRQATGVQGIDLSVVDLEDPSAWFEWMDDHAQEHILIRQAFGIA